jgi:hypothetical protein
MNLLEAIDIFADKQKARDELNKISVEKPQL